MLPSFPLQQKLSLFRTATHQMCGRQKPEDAPKAAALLPAVALTDHKLQWRHQAYSVQSLEITDPLLSVPH
jgi:hypothetical protein